jgi:ABC-type multidrug transport system fused ATPase/permease subunit
MRLVGDEATSSLDSSMQAIINQLIQDEFRENTIIAIAHRLETLWNADNVLLLDGGRMKTGWVNSENH